MKFTNAMLAMIVSSVVLILGMVTALIALDKDPTQVITFLGSILVPSVIALFGAHKADGAAVSARQAVDNTNGRMGELIRLLSDKGIPVPDGYDDVPVPESDAR